MLTSAAEDLDVMPPKAELENIKDRVLAQEQLFLGDTMSAATVNTLMADRKQQ